MSHVFLIVALAAVPGQVLTDSSPESTADQTAPTDRAALTSKLAKEEVSKWEFFLAPDEEAKLTLQPNPVLRWSNPVTGSIYGEVFIWTHRGRPEVVVSVHKLFGPTEYHATAEFQSLSVGKLTGMRNGQRSWHPAEAGVDLKTVPGADAPAEAAGRRLMQMRSLARQFSASFVGRDDQRWQLRVLPQPIYRYESTDPDLADGALFAIVQGNNPDAWLLIEARRTDEGPEWQYALGRMRGDVALHVHHRNREVWRAPRVAPPWPNVRDPAKPYFLFRVSQP